MGFSTDLVEVTRTSFCLEIVKRLKKPGRPREPVRTYMASVKALVRLWDDVKAVSICGYGGRPVVSIGFAVPDWERHHDE